MCVFGRDSNSNMTSTENVTKVQKIKNLVCSSYKVSGFLIFDFNLVSQP